ncbi:Uncharacterised protein [Chlamydia trachomatis]|nr:Uncharacterised protein [Chlamydia trachomatis]
MIRFIAFSRALICLVPFTLAATAIDLEDKPLSDTPETLILGAEIRLEPLEYERLADVDPLLVDLRFLVLRFLVFFFVLGAVVSFLNRVLLIHLDLPILLSAPINNPSSTSVSP